MNKTVLSSFIIAVFLQGCYEYNSQDIYNRQNPYTITYEAYLEDEIEPRDKAIDFPGHLGNARDLVNQILIPHQSDEDIPSLHQKLQDVFLDHLGLHDYIMLGKVLGKSNAYGNLDQLKEKILKRAAQEGGDVVLFYESGQKSLDSGYGRYGYGPGYGRYGYGLGYGRYGYGLGYGRYGYGPGYGRYSYGPGYGRYVHGSYASGIVLRHDPEAAAIRERPR